MTQPLNIAIACGGTGGHLFPGLAVARQLRRQGHHVTLWLSGRNTEATVLQDWGGPSVTVPAMGMAGLSLKSIRAVALMISAFFTSRKIMESQRPNVLLGMGSYAIVGPVLAARSLRIPVILHEANAVPGRAISALSNVATCTAITFPGATQYLGGRRSVLTGLPIRELEPTSLPDGARIDTSKPVILVMGGSQGASFINDTVSQTLCELNKEGAEVSVIHLTGPKDLDRIRDRYQTAGVSSLALAFLKDMGAAYSIANLAICRSGASSCMELAACKIPALYIPLPSAMRNHQFHNAEAMAASGGAICMEQHTVTVESLKGKLRPLLQNVQALPSMKARIDDSLAKDATVRLADLLVQEAQHAHL